MNDEQTIARVRAALDEVEATRTVAVAPRPVPGWGRQRLFAVAAVAVLVGGAVTAVLVNMSNRDRVSPAAGGGDTVAPTTVTPVSEAQMPYVLAAADLPPGPVTVLPVDPNVNTMITVWAREGDVARGLLVATQYDWLSPDHDDPEFSPESTIVEVAGTTLAIESMGVTAEERSQLAAQIVPGSGVPWLLPVDGWEWLGTTSSSEQSASRYQTYGDPPATVVLYAGDGVGALRQLIRPPGSNSPTADVAGVVIDGLPGWRATVDDGDLIVVVWHDDRGEWFAMRIPGEMADREAALIAAVAPTTDTGSETVTTVPTPTAGVGEVSIETAVSSYALAPYDDTADVDPAVGEPIPPIRLTDGTTLTVDAPTLFVFVADWCPHCNRELPLIAAAVEDGTLDGVDVIVVATGSPSTRDEWNAWLAEKGWTGDVIFDTNSGERAPGQMAGYFGTPGYPYMVMVTSDGTVAGRKAGEQSIVDIIALAVKDSAA